MRVQNLEVPFVRLLRSFCINTSRAWKYDDQHRIAGNIWNTAAHRCCPKSRISSTITEDISTHFSLPVLEEENANEQAVLCK